MDRRTFNALLGGGAFVAAAPALIGRAAAAVPKIGFVYLGPRGDYGWTYQHDVGRKDVVAKFGDKVQTTFVENVPESADAERVIADLASKGHSLIFTTSFGYMNPTIKVAQQYPKVFFEHCTGYKRAANVGTYNIRYYEGRYVQGVIAGKMSKSGVIGYVASVPIPEVVMGINATLLGMQSVNPKARLKFVFINEWYDPGKEGDAAKALLDQGCDIITQHTDSPAPLQVCQQHGVKAFGEASDMIKFAPKSQLTAPVNEWGPYYVKRVQDLLDGKWKPDNVWGGLASGMLVMAPYRNMTADAQTAGKAAEAGIKSGKLLPFHGPIKDQTGGDKVAAGKALDDGAIASMNWLVQGVEGKLPA
ncbi:MAG TPA: BMP family ABC transporter substrate-binding protein [Beijerinckiaceae bacterium]|nr:BMP family ABC transporter substrate-binding protein [Beijerinckiaceae bacterium]